MLLLLHAGIIVNPCCEYTGIWHDDVIKSKHFPRNWPFVREIHRSPVNFPHKGQWRGALMFSLIYAWINDWVNNREAGDLRRQHGHYDVIVMWEAKFRYLQIIHRQRLVRSTRLWIEIKLLCIYQELPIIITLMYWSNVTIAATKEP